LSQDSRQTKKEYFLPEWVIGVFYGSEWHDVEEGSFRENVETTRGTMMVYVDSYSRELIFLKEEITGYKIKPREFRPVVVTVDGD
jgi:hypothetical protein